VLDRGEPSARPTGRVGWHERDDRPGWDVLFTPAGGRLRGDDPVDLIRPDLRPRVERVVSQAAFAITQAPPGHRPDHRTQLWAASCRKVLQRGTRPRVSTRADSIIRTRLADGGPDVTDPAWIAGLVSAAGASPRQTRLDPSYELHPTYEQPFWESVREVAPGIERWLLPQAPLDCLTVSRGRRPNGQWVDFLYTPPWLATSIVIEIDGRAGHQRHARDVDADRDGRAWAARLAVRRSGGEAIIRRDGPILSGLKREATERWRPLDEVDPSHLIALHAPGVPARLGLAIVEAVLRGHLPPGGPWRIEVHDETLELGSALLGSALDVLWAISDIWSLDVVPDEVMVGNHVWQLSEHGGREGPVTVARRDPDLEITLEPARAYWEALPSGAGPAQVVVRGVGVPVDLAWLPTSMPERTRIAKSAPVGRSLRLLATDVFGYPEFRPGQEQAIRQLLAGQDSLVLLPTGSGKSLIYQVGGLLQPGTTMVIDPLVSLIDDQEERLASIGLDRTAALHAARLEGAGIRDATLDAVASGDASFVFATPERLQSKRFREHLATAAQNQLINCVIVDESHCVSEWGHAFRTAYLRLADNLRRLCSDAAGAPPGLTALTGTASPAVFRDAVRELAIDPDADGAIQRPDTHDRPNLEYRVRVGPETQWLALVLDTLTETIPKELDVPLAALAEQRGPETLSGIVFVPHANGEHGVEEVRAAIIRRFADRGVDIAVEVYAGQGPDGTEDTHAARKAEAAARFKQNAVPLLVATKAFGMGIDKPNIRYTVHAGIPDSVEAFAQEAGRAGRDGRRAICVLTGVVPGDADRSHVLDPMISPDERVERARDLGRRKLGDVDRQLFLLGLSFPGADEEVSQAIELLDRLHANVTSIGGQWDIPRQWPKAGNKRERREVEKRLTAQDRALYRLGILGVIGDMTKDAGVTTVHVGPFSARRLDDHFLEYIDRIEPGRAEQHRGLVEASPEAPRERIIHHLRCVVEAVYRIVYRSRIHALESMATLALRHQEPHAIRSYINSYLGSGPVASVLSSAVVADVVDIPRFIQRLAALADSDQDEIAPQAARQAEAYPDHPIILLATAIGEVRLPDGDEGRFQAALRRSFSQMREYDVSPEDAASGARWLIRQLRTDRRRRWQWAIRTMEAWESSGYPDEFLAPIEDEILTEARRGRYRLPELRAVSRRRTIRGARAAKDLGDRLVGTAPSGEKETEP
jgi:ATP-dependent DNA helicase RecQ